MKTGLVTEVPLRTDLLERASRAGAVAVLSASLNPFNYDEGEGRAHLDSIEFRILAPPVPLARHCLAMSYVAAQPSSASIALRPAIS